MSYVDLTGSASGGSSLVKGIAPSRVQGFAGDVILSGSDALREVPQLLPTFYKTYGVKTPFLAVMLMYGMRIGVKGPKTRHWENVRSTDTFTVGSVITPAGGAGQNIVIAVSAADMSTGPDGVVRSRPRVYEKYMFNQKEYSIVSKNTTVNPHQLTIRPRLAANNANTDIIAGAKAFFTSTSFGEGTGQPDPLIFNPVEYENTFTIVKDTQFSSGTHHTTEAPFKPIGGPNGYWVQQDRLDADARHEKQKSNAIIFGQVADNITQSSNSMGTVSVTDTEGLLQFAQTYGLNDTFSDLPSYNIDDIYALAQWYRDNWLSGNDVMIGTGGKMYAQWERLFKDYLQDTAVDYVRSQAGSYMQSYIDQPVKPDGTSMSAGEIMAQFGIVCASLNGYNFHLGSINEFDDIQGAGAAGQTYNQSLLAMPIKLFKDAQDNSMKPVWGYAYREGNGYNRENEFWQVGGAGPSSVNKVSEFDEYKAFYRSEIAGHFSHGDQYVWQSPLA